MISVNKSASLRKHVDTEIEYVDTYLYIDIEIYIDIRKKVILCYCQDNFLKFSVKLYRLFTQNNSKCHFLNGKTLEEFHLN